MTSALRSDTKSGPAKIFAGVSPRYVREWEEFRDSSNLQHFDFEGTDVPFYDEGHSPESILLFHGASQTAEYGFRRILQLKDRFRVVAPTVNGFRGLEQLGRGLSRLLDSRDIASVHVLGGSFGGMMAQAFFHRHCSRVRDLLLGFTVPPLPEYALLFRRLFRLLKIMPGGFLKRFTKREFSKLLDAGPSLPQETRELLEFYRAYFLYMLNSAVTKQDLIGQYRLAVAFNTNEVYRPENAVGHRGRILIVTSKNDANFKYHERLKAQYPRAEEVVYEGGGHMGSIVYEEDYMRRVRALFGGGPGIGQEGP